MAPVVDSTQKNRFRFRISVWLLARTFLSHNGKHAKDSLASDLRQRTYDARGRIAYLDCFSGISGDMFLGALIDAGVPPELLQQTALALNVGAELEIGRVL